MTRVKKSKGKVSAFFGWSSFTLCAIGLAGYMALTNDHLTSQFPLLQELRAELGMEKMVPGEGLALSNTQVQETSEGHFVVRGDVMNTSDEIRPLSNLRIKALGLEECDSPNAEGECVLKEWQLDLEQESLLPGEQLSFESSPYPLIKGTNKVGISF